MLKCKAVCMYGRSEFKNEWINPNNVDGDSGYSRRSFGRSDYLKSNLLSIFTICALLVDISFVYIQYSQFRSK